MRRHSISNRWPGGLAVAVVIACNLGASDEPAKKPGRPAPASAALPELNRKVLEFSRSQIGKQVGDGECCTLAYEALGAAGARRFRWERNGDYIWGRSVASFRDALPGDIVQFRDTVFDGTRWVTPERWVSWHNEYAHHTAVIARVRNAGREVVLLQQNVHNGADSTPIKLVQEGTILLTSLQPGGRLWIFRPIGPDEDPGTPVEATVPKSQPAARKPARPRR